MAKEEVKEVKQIQLSEVERLRLENIELKKRTLEQQYSTLEQQKKVVIESLCKANNLKIENIGAIDLDSGTVVVNQGEK